MTCRGFQFKEGETNHEETAKLCESGFHACKDPIDCFKYYPPSNSVYHEVELEDVADERDIEDTKVCAKTIKIGAEIGIPGIVKAKFEYNKKLCTNEKSGGDMSALNGGYRSALNGGDRSVLRGGENAKFRGGKDTIFASEWWENNKYKGMKSAIVDGEKIKADTWYTLKDGEFVEVEE